MNYATCTLEELTIYTNQIVKWAEKNLADSPKSRAENIFDAIGFFRGVCCSRALDYAPETIEKWRKIAIGS